MRMCSSAFGTASRSASSWCGACRLAGPPDRSAVCVTEHVAARLYVESGILFDTFCSKNVSLRSSMCAPAAQVWRPHARVSVLDSGYMLGDGVWEGIRLHNGEPACLALS